MSSTMSTFRMPNHTWSPSTSPTRPIRMSTTPKICANRLSTMSGEPPVRVAYVSRRKVYVLGHLVDAPLPTLIHPSAQKGNSPKFGSRILHSPSPTPLESPLQAPRIPEDFQAPICACYDGWVFLGVQRPRTETRSSRRSRTADASRRGIMQIRIERARLSRVIAEQDERIASESVEDVPSVDELLVAETFYGGRG